MKITLKAPAKINLCLDILRKTTSGYHEIKTIFHEVPDLADKIIISEAKKDEIIMEFSRKFICPGKLLQKIPQEQNLAYKALKLIKATFKIKKFAKITINKNIPIAAGLGGASSDAAAVLKGLNEMWNLKIPIKKLQKLGAKLGMDVPFFIKGGTALGTHFGERITQLPPYKLKFKILPQSKWPKITIPKNQTKTAYLYSKIDLKKCGKPINKTKKFHNDFAQFYKLPKNTHLSGAGPAVFKIIA